MVVLQGASGGIARGFILVHLWSYLPHSQVMTEQLGQMASLLRSLQEQSTQVRRDERHVFVIATHKHWGHCPLQKFVLTATINSNSCLSCIFSIQVTVRLAAERSRGGSLVKNLSLALVCPLAISILLSYLFRRWVWSFLCLHPCSQPDRLAGLGVRQFHGGSGAWPPVARHCLPVYYC